MSQTTYSIGKMKQLVDLNGDATNFRVVFDVRSSDGKPFEAVIINQHTLDNQETLEFKRAEGVLSGEIVANKNDYQNYYLALRSAEPMDVSVSLQFERLPDFIPQEEEKTSGGVGGLLARGKDRSVVKLLLLAVILAGAIFFYTRINKENSGKPAMKASLLEKLQKVNIP